MFAVAAFDANHKLVSELGLSAGPVATLLPLPLPHCWCQLALTAARLGFSKMCHQAAAAVVPHFITTKPDAPVWESNPMDSQQLNRCCSWTPGHDLFCAAAATMRNCFQISILWYDYSCWNARHIWLCVTPPLHLSSIFGLCLAGFIGVRRRV